MIIQEKLADASAAAPPEALLSWQGQSCDELRAIASRGVHGGELYFGAIKELERRAHNSEVTLEEKQTTAVARGREVTVLAAILFVAVMAAGIARLLGY